MIYGVHNNFRLNRKKSFRGHMVAGYACQVDFSPDGRYIHSSLALTTFVCSQVATGCSVVVYLFLCVCQVAMQVFCCCVYVGHCKGLLTMQHCFLLHMCTSME